MSHTRTPDVGDWIAYRDWGTISLGEVLRLETGYIEVRNRNEIVHVAYGVGSIVEIRSAAPKEAQGQVVTLRDHCQKAEATV